MDALRFPCCFEAGHAEAAAAAKAASRLCGPAQEQRSGSGFPAAGRMGGSAGEALSVLPKPHASRRKRVMPPGPAITFRKRPGGRSIRRTCRGAGKTSEAAAPEHPSGSFFSEKSATAEKPPWRPFYTEFPFYFDSSAWMAAAAFFPAPMARMTVAAPVTASPPA